MRRPSLPALAGLAILAFASPMLALQPAYLSEMPDPERVVHDFQGKDRMDTLALQTGALVRLNFVIKEMAGDRYNTPGQFPTADEQRVRERYGTVLGRLDGEAMATFDPKATGFDTPRFRWKSLCQTYQNSPEVYAKLMKLYFSPGFQQAHAAQLRAQEEFLKAYRKQERRNIRKLHGETGEPSPWEEMTDDEKLKAVGIGGLLALVSIAGLRLEFRKVRFDPSDPRLLRARGKLRIDWVTGTMVDYETDNGNFAIAFEGGRHDVHLAGGRFSTLQGHRMTAVWVAGKGGRPTGYLRFHDWSTNAEVAHPAVAPAQKRLFGVRIWPLFPLLAFGWYVGDTFGLLHPFVTALIGGAGWLAVIAIAGFRVRSHFDRIEVPAFLARIGAKDAAPAEPAAAP